jgi:hypothetical protein
MYVDIYDSRRRLEEITVFQFPAKLKSLRLPPIDAALLPHCLKHPRCAMRDGNAGGYCTTGSRRPHVFGLSHPSAVLVASSAPLGSEIPSLLIELISNLYALLKVLNIYPASGELGISVFHGNESGFVPNPSQGIYIMSGD